MKVPSLAIVAAVCLMQLYAATPNPRADIESIEMNGKYNLKKGHPLKDFNHRLSEVNHDGATDAGADQDLRIGLGIASTVKHDVTNTNDQQPEDKQGVGISSTHQLPDSAPAEDLRVGLGIASTLKDPDDVDLSKTHSTEALDMDTAGFHENTAVNSDKDIAGSADVSNELQGMGISGLHERPAVIQDADMESNNAQSQGMGISGLHERPAVIQDAEIESNDAQPQSIGISGLHERPAINVNNADANDQDNQGIGIASLHERPSVSKFNPKIGLGMASMHERPEMEQNPGRGITDLGVGISALHDRPPLQQQDIHMDALNETIKPDVWETICQEEDASVTASKMNGSIYQNLLSMTAPGTQFTVIAPSNTAWDGISEDVQIALYGPLGNVVSNSLLQYHIVPDVTITSNEILGYESKPFTAMSGFSLRIFDANGTLKINGLPMKKADIMASNGVLHIIDKVLVPTHP
ncbi:hypothetical protein INT43_001557 [Umbelopsis isabellina]|uniref:FAS1 domain-containing protein n=1 Tax=Mortierella isabellina TaxID=91625 RepID=A0A8H7PDT5_MORIS|nr:hypothetical protein INT43_001557 [Umbelopsis isabellina]